MKSSRTVLLGLCLLCLCLAACAEATPTETVLNPIAGAPDTSGTPEATAPLPGANQVYCQNGGILSVAPNEPLAAKVNGQPIPLAFFQRQAQQQQNTIIAQDGLDPKSQKGQEELQALQQQTLGQLIDNVLIEQGAQANQVTVSAQDLNNHIQQLIDDAGSREKFDTYLKTTQVSLDDYCIAVRTTMLGNALLEHLTVGMPTKVEQVHAAQILLASQADADKVLAELKAGKDFATAAKQYSTDTGTRDNGGDLGWFPKGIYPAELENVAFSLQPGQISGVIATPLGFHIIKVLEHAATRELDSMILQTQKQQAFSAWLDAQRNKAKIEKYVNP